MFETKQDVFHLNPFPIFTSLLSPLLLFLQNLLLHTLHVFIITYSRRKMQVDLDALKVKAAQRLPPPYIPIITVSDDPYVASKRLTTLYLKDSNQLLPLKSYHLITRLRVHGRCTHRRAETILEWPCDFCEGIFFDKFWQACADLLDYFADFYAHDTPQMRSMWFSLVDAWLESAAYVPVIENPEEMTPGLDVTQECLDKAAEFATHFSEAKALLVQLITPAISSRRNVPSEPILHDPHGNILLEAGIHGNTGPWISGLKGWQQYLNSGSPGSAIRNDMVRDANYKAKRYNSDAEEMMRQVPQPGLALLQTHGERILARAEKSGIDVPLEAPMFSREEPGEEVGQHAVYSKGIHIRAVNGMPPIMRQSGWLELEEEEPEPGFGQLDDALGRYTGADRYDPASYENDEDEEEDDESDDGWAKAFDLMVAQHMYVREGTRFVPKSEEDMFAEWVLKVD